MPLEVFEWESQAAFESWLLEFPRRFGHHSPSLLFEMYQSGELPDNDDLWEWAQFWADFAQSNADLSYRRPTSCRLQSDWFDETLIACEGSAIYRKEALGASQGLCVGAV